MPSGGGGDTTTRTEPWKGQKPYLESGFSEAERLYNQGGPGYYPNATYSPLTPQNTAAIDAQTQRSLLGSQAEGIGLGTSADIASGQYLWGNPSYGLLGGTAAGMDVMGSPIHGLLGGMATQEGTNPHLNAMFEQAGGRIGDIYRNATAPSLMSQFARSGRSSEYGQPPAQQQVSGLQRRELGDRLNDLATNMYGSQYQADQNRRLQASNLLGQAYEQGEGRRLASAGQLSQDYNQALGQMGQMAGQLPGLSQQTDYGNISQLGEAGDQLRQFDYQALQDDMNRFNFEQQAPYSNLTQYMNLIGQGGYGQTSQSSQAQNPMGLLGGIAGLAGSLIPFF